MDIGIITPEAFSEAAAPEPFSIYTQKSQRSASLFDTWQPTKIPKTDSFYIGQSLGSLRSDFGISGNNGQSMICFSSQPQISNSNDGDGVESSTLPFFLCSPKPSTTSAGIHGPFSKFRGPFTPSQWMELEHQALIYKHFISNIPVPSHLLIPLSKSFSSFPSGSYISNSYLGGRSDPEPGRCRRTDGKKWRCAREAVHDQKYCERHLNRGRHRSRKPVESQLGHSLSMSVASKAVTNDIIPSPLMMPTNKTSNSFGAIQHQFKSPQPIAPIRQQDLQALHVPEETERFGGSVSDFGHVSPDSLLNPSCRNSDLGQDIYPLRHFIDNWPKDQSNQASSWSEELKLDWTQLSMSIPVSEQEHKLSTLKLSCELEATTKMEVDVMNELKQNRTNWLPVSWGGDSVGGPLGEALNNSGSNIALDLASNPWDNNNNPNLGFSPTGVLQKSSFLSRSSSCSGNSLGAGNNKAQ